MIFIIAHPLAYYVKYVVLETTHQLTVCAPHEEEGIHFGPDNLRHCTTLERKTTLDTFTVIVLCVALYKTKPAHWQRGRREASVRIGWMKYNPPLSVSVTGHVYYLKVRQYSPLNSLIRLKEFCVLPNLSCTSITPQPASHYARRCMSSCVETKCEAIYHFLWSPTAETIISCTGEIAVFTWLDYICSAQSRSNW